MGSKQSAFTTQDTFAYYNNYSSQSKKISKKLKIHIIIVLVNICIGFIVVGAISAGDSVSEKINILFKKSESFEKYEKDLDSLSDEQKEKLKKELLDK